MAWQQGGAGLGRTGHGDAQATWPPPARRRRGTMRACLPKRACLRCGGWRRAGSMCAKARAPQGNRLRTHRRWPDGRRRRDMNCRFGPPGVDAGGPRRARPGKRQCDLKPAPAAATRWFQNRFGRSSAISPPIFSPAPGFPLTSHASVTIPCRSWRRGREAEGTRLLNEQAWKRASRVRIPPSPPLRCKTGNASSRRFPSLRSYQRPQEGALRAHDADCVVGDLDALREGPDGAPQIQRNPPADRPAGQDDRRSRACALPGSSWRNPIRLPAS